MGQGLKIDGWQERLGITFIYYRSQPFLWGKTDCWCFVSDCVKTQTGINPMRIVNGLYDTEEKGYKLLEGAVGNDGVYRKFETEKNFWSHFLGKPKDKNHLPKFGDIALVKLPKVKKLVAGVVSAFDTVFVNGDKGELLSCPLNRIKVIWSL